VVKGTGGRKTQRQHPSFKEGLNETTISQSKLRVQSLCRGREPRETSIRPYIKTKLRITKESEQRGINGGKRYSVTGNLKKKDSTHAIRSQTRGLKRFPPGGIFIGGATGVTNSISVARNLGEETGVFVAVVRIPSLRKGRLSHRRN